MRKAELPRLLYELDVPPSLYRLDGSHLELARVRSQRGEKYVVFLSERGGESDVEEFLDERTACVYFLGRVCLDLAQSGRLRVTTV